VRPIWADRYRPHGEAHYLRSSGSRSPLVAGGPAPLRNVGVCFSSRHSATPQRMLIFIVTSVRTFVSHSVCFVRCVWAALHTTITYGSITSLFLCSDIAFKVTTAAFCGFAMAVLCLVAGRRFTPPCSQCL
jgi:hypothetical protein